MRFKLRKNWKWAPGRQSVKFKHVVPNFNMLLLECGFPPFDIYLLKYPVGSYVQPHKDPVNEGKHYRVNIVLRKSEEGGRFICNGAFINFPRLKFFRPDLLTHGVSKVIKGERLVLSIGWVKK